MVDEDDLLKTRAVQLARRDEIQASDAGVRMEMLEFLLSGEHYAIETSYVSEGLSIHEMTPIPGTPPFLIGVMNVRGRIIPVVSLKKLFSLKEEGINASTQAIIFRKDSYEVAILTDGILPTRWIAEFSIKPVPSNLQGIGADHLMGVTGDAIIIIDGSSLINRLEQSLTKRTT